MVTLYLSYYCELLFFSSGVRKYHEDATYGSRDVLLRENCDPNEDFFFHKTSMICIMTMITSRPNTERSPGAAANAAAGKRHKCRISQISHRFVCCVSECRRLCVSLQLQGVDNNGAETSSPQLNISIFSLPEAGSPRHSLAATTGRRQVRDDCGSTCPAPTATSL